jgi:hypothetical protein
MTVQQRQALSQFMCAITALLLMRYAHTTGGCVSGLTYWIHVYSSQLRGCALQEGATWSRCLFRQEFKQDTGRLPFGGSLKNSIYQ